MKNYPFAQIQEQLNSAGNILIALPKGVNFDTVAGGLALSLTLQKMGKKISVVCPDPMRVEFSRLVGVDKITDKPVGSDLAIVFNYPLDSIEKVTSNDNDGKLNLIVKLKAGQAPIDQSQISFTPAGVSADLIFTVGLHKFEGLGKIYFDNKELFDQKPIVNLDNNTGNAAYGKINIVDPESLSISEMVSLLVHGMQLPIDADIASNIMLGLETATDNFRSLKTTADTFEAAALALRSGGRRSQMTITTPQPTPTPTVVPTPPAETVAETPRNDWLEPKIYKGSTLP